jgi:hypothetical protein
MWGESCVSRLDGEGAWGKEMHQVPIWKSRKRLENG